MHTRVLASAATTLLMMGACTSAADTTANQSAADPSTPTTTGSAASQAQTRCSRSEVEDLVRGTVQAYNEGDLATLDASFAPEPRFQWYSKMPTTIRDRDKLLHHFEKVSQRDEQLKLLDLVVLEERGWHGGYDFIFEFKERQMDGPWSRRFGGKGAADCQIFVWSW